MTTTSGPKTKALCVATRCADVDQFIATYHKFCDESSFFVATLNTRPIGLETAFSIQLADNTPVLRGLCTVVDAWSTPENQFNRPGIRLGIKRLTADSVDVFTRLVKAAREGSRDDANSGPVPLAQATLGPPAARPAPAAAAASADGAADPAAAAAAAEKPSAKASIPAMPPVPGKAAAAADKSGASKAAAAADKSGASKAPGAASSRATPGPVPVVPPLGAVPPKVPPRDAPPELVSLPPREVPPPSSPTPPVLPLKSPGSGPVRSASAVADTLPASSLEDAWSAEDAAPAASPRAGTAADESSMSSPPGAGALPPRTSAVPSAAGSRSTPRPFGAVRPETGSEQSGSTLALNLPTRAPASAAPAAPAASAAPPPGPVPMPPVLPPRIGRAETPLPVAADKPAADKPAAGDKPATPPKPGSGGSISPTAFAGVPSVSPVGARGKPGAPDAAPGSTITGIAFRERPPGDGGAKGGDGPDSGQAVPELSDMPESLAATARMSRRGQILVGEQANKLPIGLRDLPSKDSASATPAAGTPAVTPPPTPAAAAPAATPPPTPAAAPPVLPATPIAPTTARRPASEPSTSAAPAASARRLGSEPSTSAGPGKPRRPASEPAADAESRTPGSEFILPANPLSNLTDHQLEGFIDCTLYEDTSNFQESESSVDIRDLLPSGPRGGTSPPVTPPDDAPPFRSSTGQVIAVESPWSGQGPVLPFAGPPTSDPVTVPGPPPWTHTPPPMAPYVHTPPPMAPYAHTPPPMAPYAHTPPPMAPYVHTPPPVVIDPSMVMNPPYAHTPPPMAVDPSMGMPMGDGGMAAASPDAGYPGAAPYMGAAYPVAASDVAAAADPMQVAGPVSGAMAPYPTGASPVYLPPNTYETEGSTKSRGWIVIVISAVVALALLALAIKLGLSRSPRPAPPPRPPSSSESGGASPDTDKQAGDATEPKLPAPDPSGAASKPAAARSAPAPGGDPQAAGGASAGSAAPSAASTGPAPAVAATSGAGAGASVAAAPPAAAAGTPGGPSAGTGVGSAAIATAATTDSASTPGSSGEASDASSGAAAGGSPVVGSGPCRVTISSTPAGSNVKVDGEKLGVSPMTVEGPCKPRKVEVSHPRYAPVTRVVTPAEGKAESVEITLVRPTHTLSIVTSPPGATISIEGRRAGTSPAVVQIMGFNGVKVTIEKSGYKTVTQRFYSKVPQDRLSVRLLQSFGGR